MARILAAPREAGTPAAAAAREAVGDYLRHLGYDVTLQPFTFSPAALLAFPLFGAAVAWLGLLVVPFLLIGSLPAWAALSFWVGGISAAALIAVGVGVGWTPLGQDVRSDANLIATRNDVDVTRWLVAHLDSKAQGHSMAGRLVAVWSVIVAAAVLSALAAMRVAGPLPAWAAVAGALLGVLSGVLAGRGKLEGTSIGALDNATGLRAALTAAEASDDSSTGVLITGAEEFGLVGGRVFADAWRPRLDGADVVNFDTIDDEGTVYLISHDRRGAELARRLNGALGGLGVETKPRRLPLGIFVDSAALARAGASAVTVGRLTWRTLGIIHTAHDTGEGLRMRTAEQIGRALGRSGRGWQQAPAVN